MSNEEPTLKPSERMTDMLIALRQLSPNGEWISRSDVARIYGKRLLSPDLVLLLDLLAEQGKIEVRKMTAKSGNLPKFEYRPIRE